MPRKIVGLFFDDQPNDQTAHSLLKDGDTFTIIDVPDATQVVSILMG